MAKRPAHKYELSSAVALTLMLHLAALMVPVPVLPPVAAVDPSPDPSGRARTGPAKETIPGGMAFREEMIQGDAPAAVPYRPNDGSAQVGREVGAPDPVLMAIRLPEVQSPGSGFHLLLREAARVKLLPPPFFAGTIPKKPDKDMFRLVEENAESYLQGDVFQDSVPAMVSPEQLDRREASFLAELRRDIEDGSLDMPFASFIIPAEYYRLSRALLAKGLQPAFTLDEAFARYRERLRRVAEGLPAEIDGFASVMILQRYAANKFYPGNGSGMLLDSLFHRLNDCEAGTKEVLAYLDEIYPSLTLGSNRGLLRTTDGGFIGHMQVWLGPEPATGRIVDNERGVVIETTRVGRDSILPHLAGEIFPLEDFVARYYPEIVAGTPLAILAQEWGGVPDDSRRIVGTSNHPLKMSYGGNGTLLTAQFYDLANIRTRKIENEFLRSSIPGCDPGIDPNRIDRTNLFSNFVAIDPKLRKNLIDHYLADLDYWDNQVMPQWRKPAFVPTYADLAASLLGEEGWPGEKGQGGYLQVDAESTVDAEGFSSHRRFLLALRELSTPDPWLGRGRQECRSRTLLDERLLAFLFATPTRPGFFFLPEPAARFSWPQLVADVVDDCLAVPFHGPVQGEIAALEEAAAAGGEARPSLRREIYRRAMTRGFPPESPDDLLAGKMAAAAAILAGELDDADPGAVLASRQSAASTPEEPSVAETARETGRTGINGGLVGDLFDFLREDETRALVLSYARRVDLRLSVRRAGELVDKLAALAGKGTGHAEEYLAELGREAIDPHLKIAAKLARARLQKKTPAEVSAIAAHYLQGRKPYRAEDLLALLRYGLSREDAMVVARSRIETALAALPELAGHGPEAGAAPEIFVELVELARTLDILADPAARRAMSQGLVRSLSADFGPGAGEQSRPDFGLVFNKLSVLALLRETHGGRELPVEARELISQAIRFAAGRPAGKLMVGLLDQILTPEQYALALSAIVEGQFAELAQLEQGSSSATDRGRREAEGRVRNILGDANVLARMLLQAEALVKAKIAGLLPDLAKQGVGDVAASYLEQLHRQAAAIVTNGRPGDAYIADFYLDDRVREAMAMLAFVQREGDIGERVRFRKIQGIREIKDPSKIRVIEAERKITRQDMSLLTLALNDANRPREIRRAWEETLAVTDGHLRLSPRDATLASYLFAPHFPYLQGDDLGFFFSPEAVEDLHNADQWGGRNDILLSSYLHFRNLPERLPEWLLRAALLRSEFERRIIKKFERQSFLPMILECADDHQNLPEGLFRAQWTIRKPFGEDIFPATLLLLRMGYMAITPEGELIFTAKYTG